MAWPGVVWAFALWGLVWGIAPAQAGSAGVPAVEVATHEGKEPVFAADRIAELLLRYANDPDPSRIAEARQAAAELIAPLGEGGHRFEQGDDLWFEARPTPVENPPHDLAGHLRALLALRDLGQATGDPEYRPWFERGLRTLERWLPLYDTGYALRRDLRPRGGELLFRIAEPYGYRVHPLAVDRISLRDPASGDVSSIDVGGAGDAEGPARIAGTHWGQPETLAGRSVRRLVPADPEMDPSESPDAMVGPHSYFYFGLPGEWSDNLRAGWYELEVEYYDDAQANLTVQGRAIAPGPAFHDLRDGDLMLSGARQWRKWVVPLRTADLGLPIGAQELGTLASLLGELAEPAGRLAGWAATASGYRRLAEPLSPPKGVTPVPWDLPPQTPLLPICTLDESGVLMQSRASPGSRFSGDGRFDPLSDRGVPIYSPFIIANQLIEGANIRAKGGGAYSDIKPNDIHRQPALAWFLNPENQKRVAGAVLYEFAFDNTYNDVVTRAPWASAFSQAYILKAFLFARQHMANVGAIASLLPAVVRAYGLPVPAGGLAARDRSGNSFFEEVPNATHVLNAHLVSIPELWATGRSTGDPVAVDLAGAGTAALREKLARFDTGYWMKYDQNPKKDLLFQLDWLNGYESPAIDEIYLENPQTGTAVRVDVGAPGDSQGPARISGSDWLNEETSDQRTLRRFRNGYAVNAQAVAGAGRHNVFFSLALPEPMPADLFDLPVHRLVVRYRDTAPGRFAVRVQAIDQGKELTFVPLRNGLLRTVGDGRWKEAVFSLRPQDMGWFKGSDYQDYEVKQLLRIAHLSNDGFFYQYAGRQRYFLARQQAGLSAMATTEAGGIAIDEIDPATVRIASASATYPGSEFANALDGNALDNYVAGLEAVEQPYVDLDLGTPTALAGVKVQWLDGENRARTVRFFGTEGDSAESVELPSNAVPEAETTTYWFSGARPLRYLHLEFADFAGQPRVLLRRLALFPAATLAVPDKPAEPTPAAADALPPLLAAELFRWGRSGDFLARDDARNPLRRIGVPISQDVKALADLLARGAQSDHERVLRFMDYLNRVRIGLPSDVRPDTVLKEGLGDCGTLSGTLLAFAVAEGLEGRFVNLHNYPSGDGHTVVEILADGAWRLYDPSFGAYYLAADDPGRGALSFAALSEAYRAGAAVEPVVGAQRDAIKQFVGRDPYVSADPAGVIGPDWPMEFPLALSLDGPASLTAADFGPTHQGADYLGAGQENVSQRWRLSGLTPGADYVFSLDPGAIGGDFHPPPPQTTASWHDWLPRRLRRFLFGKRPVAGTQYEFAVTAELVHGQARAPLAHTFAFGKDKAEPWDIAFRADAPEVILRITHPYRGPEFRYINIARYKLKRAP